MGGLGDLAGFIGVSQCPRPFLRLVLSGHSGIVVQILVNPVQACKRLTAYAVLPGGYVVPDSASGAVLKFLLLGVPQGFINAVGLPQRLRLHGVERLGKFRSHQILHNAVFHGFSVLRAVRRVIGNRRPGVLRGVGLRPVQGIRFLLVRKIPECFTAHQPGVIVAHQLAIGLLVGFPCLAVQIDRLTVYMDRHGCLSVRDKAGVTVKAPAQFFQIVCHVVLAVSLGFRRVDKRIEEPATLLRLSQSAVFLRKGLGQERKSGDNVVYGVLR